MRFNPRAPCFSSIKNTLYVSEVSNVTTACSLAFKFTLDVNCKLLIPNSSSDSEIYASVKGDLEKMRYFAEVLSLRISWRMKLSFVELEFRI